MFRFLLLSIGLFCSLNVFGQTTIFNAPSTDVAPDKSYYFEANYVQHFDKLSKGGFQTYGFKNIYGIKKKVEVGTNFYFTRSASPSLKEFQANAKWKIYQNEKRGFAFAAGTQIFVPLRNKTGLRTISMIYTNASKIIPKTKGLRVTGGYYSILRANTSFGTKRGAIFAVEQPITKKLNFIADWYSGKNRFGYGFGGFSYFVTNKQILYAGYNFGNVGRANNSLAISYGINY